MGFNCGLFYYGLGEKIVVKWWIFIFFWLLIYCGFLVGEKRLCGFSGFNWFVLFGAKRGGICLIGAKLVPTEAGRNGASL